RPLKAGAMLPDRLLIDKTRRTAMQKFCRRNFPPARTLIYGLARCAEAAMLVRDRQIVLRVVLGVICLGISSLTLPAPASAGFLERLFGTFRHSFHPPREPVQPSADPYGDGGALAERGVGGPPTSYCVRSCDGHYFPVQEHTGLSATDACRSFC